MPSRWTFKIPAIDALLSRYLPDDGHGWADPFAGKSTLAQYRNDLDQRHDQPAAVEAIDFLSSFSNEFLDGVLFDPPYSLTQVSRSYAGMGLQFRGSENPTGGFPRCRDEIARILRHGGLAISFGWNTVGMGIKRGFLPIEYLIVCHGGNRNDTLVTVERRE